VVRAVIYLRVSTEEQAESGLGLEAQEAKCRQACQARGWDVAAVMVDAGVSGKVEPSKRPGLVGALDLLCGPKRARTGDVLVVAKLDRAARSAFDLLWLRREADRCGFELAVLDPDLDTTTAAGNFQFTVMAGVAELERDLISQRTRDALTAKKARGARLGRPVVRDRAVRARVSELRADGLSIAAVADALNAEGHRQGNGSDWTKSAVQKVLRSVAHDDYATTRA
jgi:DNA invertase Pin-like site-specific DNA recombinase